MVEGGERRDERGGMGDGGGGREEEQRICMERAMACRHAEAGGGQAWAADGDGSRHGASQVTGGRIPGRRR